MLEQTDGPSLDCLGHQRMICVGTSPLGHVPGGIPFQTFDVNQQTHQLSNGQRWMSVVQLNGDLEGHGRCVHDVHLHEDDDAYLFRKVAEIIARCR